MFGKKIIAIIQARENSSRFPNKVLKKINKKSIIEIIFKRLKKAKKLSDIVYAVPKSDKKIISILKKKKIKYFLGSESNVLKRYHDCAKFFKADTIVRITADCPLVDPNIIDKMIHVFKNKNLDYLSNAEDSIYPDGLDTEIFNFKSLEKSFKFGKSKKNIEHVTFYISENKKKFKISNFLEKKYKDYSNLRLTLDNEIDYFVIKRLFSYFKNNFLVTYNDIYKLINKNPELFLENKFFKRNYGLNKINKKYSFFEAEKIIPTGNQMLSKNPKYILPNQWPLYYKKANGCMITSLDGKKYYDFSLMGVGTNILGYSNKIVDNFVKKKIDCGSMSTLNCFEELDLAKELIQMNKWADMVRFARTGGEINSIAIRIARAAAGKDKVAFCGYHGWHDWYLSANLKNKKNLNNHLMSGFFTSGVPKFLSNKSYTFKFNDINSVKKLIALDKNIGVIKLEVYRNIEPKRSFLKELRKICDKEKIVLIFDECTSGFRSNYGGIYQKYGITPDIVLFGKALGNGYPITACVGKKEVMENVKSSFISSTFWSERIGFSAGLITLKEMRKINSWNKITNIGKYIRRGLSNVAKQHGLKIEFLGLPALTNFQFKTKNSEYLNAYLTQEMLKRGYLFGNSIYTSVAHEEDIVNNYLDNLNDILDDISGNISEKNYLINNLNGPLPKKPFNRMN